jgi:hypothetical protein
MTLQDADFKALEFSTFLTRVIGFQSAVHHSNKRGSSLPMFHYLLDRSALARVSECQLLLP